MKNYNKRTRIAIIFGLAFVLMLGLIFFVPSEIYSTSYAGKLDDFDRSVRVAFWGVVIICISSGLKVINKPKAARGLSYLGWIWILGITFAGCFFGKNHTTKYNTMEYKKRDSLLQVEKSKKFQLVKVLSCQPRAAEKATIAVDAYGQPIEIGKWYLRSRVTKMLFPYGDQGSPQLTSSQLCTAENTGSLPFVGSVLIDTTQFLLKDNTEYGTFEMEGKVEIICFPGQQVSIHFDQEKVIGEISDSVVKK